MRLSSAFVFSSVLALFAIPFFWPFVWSTALKSYGLEALAPSPPAPLRGAGDADACPLYATARLLHAINIFALSQIVWKGIFDDLPVIPEETKDFS